MVDVAADYKRRCDAAQPVKHLRLADVARMQDQLYAA
jgi:hypothetical protein